MTAELLFPVLTLSHTARDSKKVFQFFEAMLDTDTQRQGGAASTAVRQLRPDPAAVVTHATT